MTLGNFANLFFNFGDDAHHFFFVDRITIEIQGFESNRELAVLAVKSQAEHFFEAKSFIHFYFRDSLRKKSSNFTMGIFMALKKSEIFQ